MTDDVGVEDADAEYFDQLITTITAHPDWAFEDGDGEVVAQAVSERMYEGEIRHGETDSMLRVQMPREDGETAVSGALRNTVLPEPHHNRTPPEDGFHRAVDDAYTQIAETHTTEYVEPRTADAERVQFTLLDVEIPWDYTEDSVAESLDALSDAATEVDELNQAIRKPVVQYLNE